MTLILPDWYDPDAGCPDVERDVLRPLFQPHLTGANVDVVSWIPKPDVYQAKLDAGGGYLRTYRTGGRWNDGQKRDEPIVQLAALMPSRDLSWDLIKFVRDVLRCFIRESDIVPGTGIKISVEGEVSGPQLIPELLQSDKLVPITVQLYTWPQRVRDYSTALGLNL